MSMPAYWEEAKAHLSGKDPVMAGIIAAYQGEALRGRGDAFYTLARSIVGQQISVKAADAVWGRLEARVGVLGSGFQVSGEKKKRGAGAFREAMLTLCEEELRSCGLSRSKAIYIRSLAEFFSAHDIGEGHWSAMTDEEVVNHLIQIKGIGRWSAEMFMIFHLLRPDVFPVADIGLQKAVALHYGAAKSAKKSSLTQMERLGKSWKPYRSAATWYLWRSLDPVPVEY